MYIAIFLIALSIRASNTYEGRTLGVFPRDSNLDEQDGAKYLLSHVRNQLSFDLWYIFLGIFCICISESERIMRDTVRPSFPSGKFEIYSSGIASLSPCSPYSLRLSPHSKSSSPNTP